MLDRAQAASLVAFAALLGTAEGPAQIACVAALVALLAGRRAHWDPVFIGLGVWALAGAWGLFQGLAAGIKISSEPALRPLMVLALGLGAFGLCKASDATLRRVGIAFMVALTINGAYGYLQLALGELPLDRWLLKNPNSQQIWAPERTGEVRAASGLFYNRLKLAHLGILGLGLMAITAAEQTIPKKWRLFWIGAAFILGGAVVLTYARMALAAALGGGVILALVLAKRRILLGLAGAGALLFGLVLATPQGWSRVVLVGRDLRIRMHLFDTAWGLFERHPWLGVGHGMYRPTVAPTFDGKGTLMDAHNLLLQILAETGLVGFLGFVLALLVVLARLVGRVRAAEGTVLGKLRDRFVLYGLGAILVLGTLHMPLHHAPVALAFWLLFGAAAGVPRGAKACASF